MMRAAIAGAVLLALCASAVAQTFTLTLTEAQLNLVGKALGKLPYEDVAPTINAIMQQVVEQQRAAAPKKEPAKE